ncbi:hypothetical protein ACFX5K_06000 [Rickettsiales bacterium LUAb2]
MYNLLQNEHFWVYLCFILFIAIFGKICYVQFKKFLESQVEIVTTEINNSNELLDLSKLHLKEKTQEINSLEEKIQAINKLTKDLANSYSETFFDNLALKETFLANSFKNYINIEKQLNDNKLKENLINNSHIITINILKENLSNNQKQQLITDALVQLPSLLNSYKKHG